MKNEFLALNGAAQAVLHHQSFNRLHVHGFVKKTESVAPGLFCAVHGHVRFLEQALKIGPVLWEQRDADGGATGQLVAVGVERLLQPMLELGQNGRDDIGIRKITKQNQEFIATLTADRVGFTDAA